MRSHDYAGGSEADRPSGNGSGVGKWPSRNYLPRWALGPGSDLCALGWEERSARLGNLCTKAVRNMSWGPVSSSGPSHLSWIFSIGLMVRCGSIKFIQNPWRIYSGEFIYDLTHMSSYDLTHMSPVSSEADSRARQLGFKLWPHHSLPVWHWAPSLTSWFPNFLINQVRTPITL